VAGDPCGMSQLQVDTVSVQDHGVVCVGRSWNCGRWTAM
jgi:hypothetical protein